MNPALSEGLYVNSVQMFPIALKSLGLHGPKAHFASADQLECYLFRETVPDLCCPKAFLPITLYLSPLSFQSTGDTSCESIQYFWYIFL